MWPASVYRHRNDRLIFDAPLYASCFGSHLLVLWCCPLHPLFCGNWNIFMFNFPYAETAIKNSCHHPGQHCLCFWFFHLRRKPDVRFCGTPFNFDHLRCMRLLEKEVLYYKDRHYIFISGSRLFIKCSVSGNLKPKHLHCSRFRNCRFNHRFYPMRSEKD